MVQFHGPTSMIRLLKKVVLKALDPSIGVNQMWTKKNDHASESECAKISLATQMKKKCLATNVQEQLLIPCGEFVYTNALKLDCRLVATHFNWALILCYESPFDCMLSSHMDNPMGGGDSSYHVQTNMGTYIIRKGVWNGFVLGINVNYTSKGEVLFSLVCTSKKVIKRSQQQFMYKRGP